MSNKAIQSSLQLRLKTELIKNFIEMINTSTDVNGDWQEFVQEQKEADIQKLIQEEKLKPVETKKLMENAFRDGVLKTTGTDVGKILPPVSCFGRGSRERKKQTIISKLKNYLTSISGFYSE